MIWICSDELNQIFILGARKHRLFQLLSILWKRSRKARCAWLEGSPRSILCLFLDKQAPPLPLSLPVPLCTLPFPSEGHRAVREHRRHCPYPLLPSRPRLTPLPPLTAPSALVTQGAPVPSTNTCPAPVWAQLSGDAMGSRTRGEK